MNADTVYHTILLQSFGTIGIGGYLRNLTSRENYFSYVNNAPVTGNAPNVVSHSCTASFDFTLYIFLKQVSVATEDGNIGNTVT